MVKIGTAAPDFTLPDQDGRPRRLRDLLADGPLILYFYPADFTPGCTREACDLRDLHGRILASSGCMYSLKPGILSAASSVGCVGAERSMTKSGSTCRNVTT